MTKSNEYEARYITQLCRHLILQGYEPNQITILTTYIGQMFLIKKVKMIHYNRTYDLCYKNYKLVVENGRRRYM